MGLEFRIEAHDLAGSDLSGFLRRLPEFLYEEDDAFHLGLKPANVLFTVKIEDNYVYACQHVASRETDALLGGAIRRLLALNDRVTVSEL